VSRSDEQRLADVVAAIEAIRAHIARGGLDDGLVVDAVRILLIEIGEAVNDVDPGLLASEPGIPWTDIAGMRDIVAHRYFDTARAVVQATIDNDLPPLAAAVERLLRRQRSQGG
jgi:uncharacterized protein with HEPN domain